MEKDDKRSIERSLMQMQTLADSLPWKDASESSHRMTMFYSVKHPPFWVVENELIKILKSVGSTKTALDLSLKLQLWEEVIDCYHLLDLRHKAVEVIQKQIDKDGETPRLLCMLGDATDDPQYYEKAIVVSESRSARAYRSMGTYHFQRKDYEKAVENYAKSISLNSFQPNILLRLGYSAMQVKAWDVAAQSYRNYCVYESDVSIVFNETKSSWN